MRYLITGGAGFVGANLVERCTAEVGAEVTVLDSLDPRFRSAISTLAPWRDKITFIQADLRDERTLAEVVDGQDVVIHCAGQTSHSLSMSQPLLDAELNCLASLSLLESLRRFNPRACVVFASTTTVAGTNSTTGTGEDFSDRPLDIYSANHGVVEKYFHIYAHAHGLKTACVRLPNLYGPLGKHDPQFGFINYFIGQSQADAELPVFGDGNQRRNVLYVEDAVEALLLAARLSAPAGQTFVAAGDEHLSVREIAEQIVAVFGQGRILHVDWPNDRRQIEIGDVEISSQQLPTVTGWQPRLRFVEGLRRTRDAAQQRSGAATL